ncbi:hypothetical protein [Bradyrhizobium sp. STM 3557]|uniref:hypothetical protein n=1 Tax=Bradyrhizobium sp. STM 3557 TaxID=578920 RepID=UPI00388D4ECD
MTLAGSNAAAVAAGAGLSPAAISAAATAAATAASNAASSILAAGGSVADATAAAVAVANAAGLGGAAAAQAVADAAAVSGLPAAQAAVSAAEGAFNAAGGAAGGPVAITDAADAARAVTDAAEVGGGDAAAAVARAAQSGGETSAQSALQAAQDVRGAGGTPADAARAARAIADTAEAVFNATGEHAIAANAAETLSGAVRTAVYSVGLNGHDAAELAVDLSNTVPKSIGIAQDIGRDPGFFVFSNLTTGIGYLEDFGMAGVTAFQRIISAEAQAAGAGGRDAFDAVLKAVQALDAEGTSPGVQADFASLIADAAVTGAANGPAAGAASAEALLQRVPQILDAAAAADRVGGFGAVDAVFRGADAMITDGASADDVLRVAESIAEGARFEALRYNPDPSVVAQRANDFADVATLGAETHVDADEIVSQIEHLAARPEPLPPPISPPPGFQPNTPPAPPSSPTSDAPPFLPPRPASAPPTSNLVTAPPAGGSGNTLASPPPGPASASPRLDASQTGPNSPASSAGGLSNTLVDTPSMMDGGGPRELTGIVATPGGGTSSQPGKVPVVDASSESFPIFETAQPLPFSPGSPTPTDNIVATASGDPIPLNPVGPADNAYEKLLHDLQSGADKGAIRKDAQRLAIVAADVNDGTLEKVALLVGSDMYGSSAVDLLKAASPELADQDNVYAPQVTDPLGGLHSPLNDAYLTLEVDIAGGPDPQKIKADADQVTQLAKNAGQPGLESAASNISNSITDGSYDQSGSLTALMNNAPTLSTAQEPPAPGPLVPPSDIAAYDKLKSDIQSGADAVTIISDAAQLATAAAGTGDTGLETVARNIGNSAGNGTYSTDGSLSALDNAAPGTAGATGPQGLTPSDTADGAYLKLESDVEHGADPQTIKADAEEVKSLAQKNGSSNLVAAADAIISGIDNGGYDQVGAEEALMNDGTTPENTGGSISSDETSAYQKLVSDIRAGADNATLMNDVFSLSEASISNGDFGLGKAALDIGNSVKGGTFDANATLQSLTNTAPGTSAAQLPPISNNAA